jgi:putative spermidine/putrescine transport system substrate-binding protein
MSIGKAVKLSGVAAAFVVGGITAYAAQEPNLQGQQITVAEFGGALTNYVKQAWTVPFEKSTGAKVDIDTPNARAKLKAQVESGNAVWDVFTEDAAFIQQNCGVLFEKVDTSKFVAAGIDKRFVTNDCGVPTSIVASAFVFNEDKFGKTPPKNWADFFDLKKFPGKRAVWNNPTSGLLEAALLADGVAVDKLYPLDLDRAFKKLDSIKSSIFWTQSTGGLTDALANNQVDLALAYAGRAYAAAKTGAKIDLVSNQELVSWDQYAVVKGSKHKAAAEDFLEFIAQPQQQAKLTELTSYATANAKGHPNVDALTARFLPNQNKAVFTNQDWWAKNFDNVNQRFVEWQSK